ncbi:MAG: hypothetical protein AABZ31_14700 [Bdellovibrionota bacterium]
MIARLIFLVLILGAGTFAQADSFTLTEISGNGKRAELKVQGSLLEGDYVKYTDKFDENCFAKVIKVTGATAIIDLADCDNAKALKPGLVFTRTTAPAPSPSKAMPTNDNQQTSGRTISRDEDWYTLWGFGFTSTDYDEEAVNDIMDDADDEPGVDRSTANYDLFGFYWPMADKKTMHGFIINVVSDSLDGPGGELYITQTLYAYSIQRFYGANIGDGWFIRGDLGVARATIDVETYTYDDSDSGDFGLGILGGGGYALSLSQETRILFGAYVTSRKSGSDQATSASLNMGFLF